MLSSGTQARLSPRESERFGVKVARGTPHCVEDVAAYDRFAADHGVALLIARMPTTAIDVLHAFEQGGALLMDCIVAYDGALPAPQVGAHAHEIRVLGPEDAEPTAAVAGSAFAQYSGHYHADPKLDPAACAAAYSDWAYRCCIDPSSASVVFGAFASQQLIGFLALLEDDARCAEIVLNAVDPRVQRTGCYTALLAHALHWAAERGLRRCLTATPVANRGIQRVWTRFGFEPAESFYTVHKWYPQER